MHQETHCFHFFIDDFYGARGGIVHFLRVRRVKKPRGEGEGEKSGNSVARCVRAEVVLFLLILAFSCVFYAAFMVFLMILVEFRWF